MAKQNSGETPQDEAIRLGRERQAEAVRLQEERDQVPPTPTQDENDRAKLGVLSGEGAPSDPEPAPADTARKAAGDGGAPYKNRAAQSE